MIDIRPLCLDYQVRVGRHYSHTPGALLMYVTVPTCWYMHLHGYDVLERCPSFHFTVNFVVSPIHDAPLLCFGVSTIHSMLGPGTVRSWGPSELVFLVAPASPIRSTRPMECSESQDQ